MIKELRLSSEIKTIKGDFCVTSISHSNPETEVYVRMGTTEYRAKKPNVECFVEYVEGEPMLNFFNGLFCNEIEISVPDAHIILVYEDLSNESKETDNVS